MKQIGDQPLTQKEKRVRYNERHPGRTKEQQTLYSKEHPDQVKETQKRYRDKNKEKLARVAKEKYDADPEKFNARTAAWRLKPGSLEKERNKHYKRKFGITVEIYKEMYDKQNGLCAICCKPETIHSKGGDSPMWLSVDHNHTTKKVRGLLCFKCNTTLSYFEKHGESMITIASYLKENK